MADREMFDVYVVISNQAVMRVKVGYRTKIRNVLQVLADNFGYEGALSALVVTEVVPVAFEPGYEPDFKERVAKARLPLTLSEPERFAKLVHDATMEECGVWEDGIIYVIIEGFDSPVDAAADDAVLTKGGDAAAAPTPGYSATTVPKGIVTKSIVTKGIVAKGGAAPGRRGDFGHGRIVHAGAYHSKGAPPVGERKEADKPKSYSALLQGQLKFNFLDASQLKCRRDVPSAPRYRIYGTGANYECTCANADCAAYKKQVIVPVGHTKKSGNRPFEQVYLHRAVKCPLCKHAVPAIHSFGFSNCIFEWKGVTGDGVRREYRGVAPPNRYTVYSGSEAVLTSTAGDKKPTASVTGKAMEWAVLVVTTALYNPDEDAGARERR